MPAKAEWGKRDLDSRGALSNREDQVGTFTPDSWQWSIIYDVSGDHVGAWNSNPVWEASLFLHHPDHWGSIKPLLSGNKTTPTYSGVGGGHVGIWKSHLNQQGQGVTTSSISATKYQPRVSGEPRFSLCLAVMRWHPLLHFLEIWQTKPVKTRDSIKFRVLAGNTKMSMFQSKITWHTKNQEKILNWMQKESVHANA